MYKSTAIEAIILKSTPFNDKKVMLTLFTNTFGLVSASCQLKKSSYLSSMMLIEGTLIKGKNDIHSLKDHYILNPFPNLREDFDILQIAGKMINILSLILVKGRAVLPLFILTKNTLKALSKGNNIKAIYLCYLTKLLLFEGLLPMNYEKIEPHLSEDDQSTYLELATSKKISLLNELSISPVLEKAIENYSLLMFN